MLGIAPQEVCGPMIDLLHKFNGPIAGIWLEEFKKFLRKEKVWSTILKVDRTQPYPPNVILDNIASSYPKEAVLLHPEFESLGPTEFDMAGIYFQMSAPKRGEEKHCNHLYMRQYDDGGPWYVWLGGLYKYLTQEPSFIKECCLGLRDAEAMIKCIEYVPSKLKLLHLPLWKGVAKRAFDGELCLPYLSLEDGRGTIYWRVLSLGERAEELGRLTPCYPPSKKEVV